MNEYDCFKELTSGKGFADVVYVPVNKEKPALIVELKHNKSSESALNQIKEKKYFDSLEAFSGEILLVGINYDEAAKEHTCKIEKVVKVNQGTVL